MDRIRITLRRRLAKSRGPCRTNWSKTHCCFCGQQCGIQLKVRDNHVIGFEPWEEFPFNQGMLCPKGVKRYLQSNHPDRLLDPLLRTDQGFVKASWEEAHVVYRAASARDAGALWQRRGRGLWRSVAHHGEVLSDGEIRARGAGNPAHRLQRTAVHGFRRRRLQTRIRRGSQPNSVVAKSPRRRCCFAIGANVGECAPITTDYIWRCRDNGGKLIVADPRMTPISRNADLFLPLRPGTDLALLNGMLHVVLRDNLQDDDFIEQHTSGFDAVKASVSALRSADGGGDDRRSAGSDRESRAHVCQGRPRDRDARARTGASVERRGELLGADQSDAGHRAISGAKGCGCTMITGQGNGQGGREHGQKCDQLPGQRSLLDPKAREHVAGVWGISPDELPQPGYSAQEIMNAIHAGEIKALFSICFNPAVSLPNAEFTREALEKLEFFAVTDFFLSETARYADVVLAGSLQEEEEGVTCSAEGRVIHIQTAVDPPGNARRDSEIICDLARRLGKGKFFPFETPREIFEELREASRGGHADYYGITYEKIDRADGRVLAVPDRWIIPVRRILMQGGVSFYPDGKCRFQAGGVARERRSGRLGLSRFT